MSSARPVGSGAGGDAPAGERGWLYDHIGRIAGIVLGLLVIAFLVLLAVAGYETATGLLVVLVAGVVLIALGNQLRGQMRGRQQVPTYRDEGIVLRTMRLGEADRIVTMLTAEHGKVRAVGKGIRRTKSRMGGRLEPLSHVALLCWRGRELDIVNQAESIDSFHAIRDDLVRLGPATTILEIADQVSVEHAPTPELFTMVLGALRSLEAGASPLLLGAFCLKLLASEGVGPVVDASAHCGSPGPLVAFDVGEGGLLCSSCRRGQPVSEELVELAREVLSGGLSRALREAGGPAVEELEHVALTAVEHHLDRRLRSARHTLEGQRRAV